MRLLFAFVLGAFRVDLGSGLIHGLVKNGRMQMLSFLLQLVLLVCLVVKLEHRTMDGRFLDRNHVRDHVRELFGISPAGS